MLDVGIHIYNASANIDHVRARPGGARRETIALGAYFEINPDGD